MNARERVRLGLTCQRPDRISPGWLSGKSRSRQSRPQSAGDFFDLDVRFVQFKPPAEQNDFLGYLRSLPPDVHVGDMAQLATYHEWDYHPERGPDGPLSDLHTADASARYVFPDLTHPDRYVGLAEQAESYHRRGLAVAGSPPHLGGELYETAYRLRGFQNFMADLVMHKPLVRYLLDQLTTLLIHNALILAAPGWISCCSMTMWRCPPASPSACIPGGGSSSRGWRR